MLRHSVIAATVLVTAFPAWADCTPTTVKPVCAYVSPPTKITVRLLVPAAVKCGQLQYRGPGDQWFNTKNYGLTAPDAELGFGAPVAWTYEYRVASQYRTANGVCPVPYNYPGVGGGQIVRP